MLGTLAGEYHYDAWGNILNESSLTEIAQINPFRYRSYYYDSETGLYYLNSRYYDPEPGRFISGDDVAYLGADGIATGYNLFAYCKDNPINYIDVTGTNSAVLETWAKGAWWLCLVDLYLPIGDIVFWGGVIILSVWALSQDWSQIFSDIYLAKKTAEQVINVPDVKYPGDDPTKAPDGYEWRGPDEQGGKRGGYANPNGKDSWHPDLDHPDGIEPHWDYNDEFGNKWRVFPDRIELVP